MGERREDVSDPTATDGPLLSRRRLVQAGAAGALLPYAQNLPLAKKRGTQRLPVGFVSHGAPTLALDARKGVDLARWAAQLGESDGLFSYLSSLNHFRNLANGLIDTADLVYFALVLIGALVLAIWRLDLERRAY